MHAPLAFRPSCFVGIVRLTRAFAFVVALAHSMRTASAAQDPPSTGRPPILFDPRVGPDQGAIDECIERGVDYLLRAQNRDGSWTTEATDLDTAMDLRNGQTALSVYTLLKCRLPPKHPAIVRAVRFLANDTPTKVYPLGVELMMYDALGDPTHKPRMQKLVAALLELRQAKAFGYGRERMRADPSNMQYALLGLRAAAHSGVRVPKEVWSEAIEAVFAFQEKPKGPGIVRTGAPARDAEPAGFSYGPGENAITASMTSTCIAILALCDEMLERKVPPTLAPDFLRSKAQGLAWLEDHFSYEGNPGGNDAWHYYYVYCIERVGALLGVEKIGTHLWYKEGTIHLVRAQNPDGSWTMDGGKSIWPPKPMANANTCFALLFLSQATHKATTGESAPRTFRGWKVEAPDKDVWIRARGKGTTDAWLSGFGTAVSDAFGAGKPDFVRIVRVEWLVDGVVVSTIDGRPDTSFADPAYVLHHEFRSNGPHTIAARVAVRAVDGGADAVSQTFESGPLSVAIGEVLEPWMLAYSDPDANLLARGVEIVRIEGSSQFDTYTPAWRAVDGMQFHGWVAKAEDPEPKLTIELDKMVKTKAVVLSQPNSSDRDRNLYGRVKRVRLAWNDESKPVEFDLDVDPLKKTTYEFEKPLLIRRIVLTVLAREPGSNGLAAGFAEVELRGK